MIMRIVTFGVFWQHTSLQLNQPYFDGYYICVAKDVVSREHYSGKSLQCITCNICLLSSNNKNHNEIVQEDFLKAAKTIKSKLNYSFYWEKIRTTNFTTSKTKKNIEKPNYDHYIEKIFKSDQNVEKGKDQNIESFP